jgi:succinate-acetate transporter protein
MNPTTPENEELSYDESEADTEGETLSVDDTPSYTTEYDDNGSRFANPSILGLTGFAAALYALQMYHLGLCGIGPVVAIGLFFGGFAQFFAGVMEMIMGNAFEFCMFTTYGTFWIAHSFLALSEKLQLFGVSPADMATTYLCYIMITTVLLGASLVMNKVLIIMFGTLLLGLVLLTLDLFFKAHLVVLSSFTLLVSSGCAMYIVVHMIFEDVYGKDMLPLGPPLLVFHSIEDDDNEDNDSINEEGD